MSAPLSAFPDLLPEHYQVLFESNPLPLLVVARDSFRILAENEAARRCFDGPDEHQQASNLQSLFHPDDWPQVQHALQSCTRSQPAEGCWRQRPRQDGVRHLELDLTLLDGPLDQACMLLVRDVRHAPESMPGAAQDLNYPVVGREDGLFRINRESRFTFVNTMAEKLLLRRSEELLGRVIWDCFPEAVQTDHYFHLTMALRGRWPSNYEVFYAPCQVMHEVHLYPSGSGVSVRIRNITRRHRELERINQERNQLHAIINASHDAIISTNMQGAIQIFSPGAERIFGVRRDAMLGRCVDLLLPERYRSAHAISRAEFAQSHCVGARMMGLRRVKGLHSDGTEIDLEGSIANVEVEGQPVLITTLRDVTRSLKVEAEQQVMHQRLSQLTQRLMLQEKELVKRVSLALHDQLGQTLAALRIVHETIAALRSQGNSAEVSRLFGQLGTLIDQSIREVRVVLADLHPPMLDENGLAAALDNELRNRSLSLKNMQMVLQAPAEVAALRWPAAVEHAVFMIAREAVENAIRHSGASLLTLSLAGGPADLTLEVWDNGCGYPGTPPATAGHLGLTGSTERANSIGAQLSLNAGEEGGAHLILHWEAAT